MNDSLIKKSDAIHELMDIIPYKRYHNGKYVSLLDRKECLAAIKAVPTISKFQEKWIPCNKRLPKKKEATYLICTENGYMCSCRWTNDMYGLGSNEWNEWGWHIMDKPQYAKVVAWAEIKPWKGTDDET